MFMAHKKEKYMKGEKERKYLAGASCLVVVIIAVVSTDAFAIADAAIVV